MDDPGDDAQQDGGQSAQNILHGSLLLLHDELHALHPQDTHGGVRLDDLPVGAARRPGLTIYIDGAGGQCVVDAFRHAPHSAQHPVGIGGLDVLFHQLDHQRAGEGQRRDGHREEQRHL